MNNPKQEIQALAAKYRMAKDPESQILAAILETLASQNSVAELAILLGKIKD